MRLTLTFIFSLFIALLSQTQAENNFWKDIAESQIHTPDDTDITDLPALYRTLSLDFSGMTETLRTAPMDNSAGSPILVTLPFPDGGNGVFEVWESPILAAGLAAKYPNIKTYSGQSLENPALTTRFDFGPNGFHAIIHIEGGTVLIEPYVFGQTEFYASYDLKDFDFADNPAEYACQVRHEADDFHDYEVPKPGGPIAGNRSVGDPVNLHKYRLAVATTAEFYISHGNSIPNVLASVTTIINNVNSILEKEAAIRLELIDGVEAVFFSDAINDGFTNGNPEELNGENFFILNAAFGIDGYDIGHVFGTNAGGLAQVGAVCNDSNKARASSSTFGGYAGSKFYIIVAHEMGHQFSALHNFNFCEGENENWPTGYEPGSGSTIMCYAGASDCGANYVQDIDDDYYHINAMIRIQNFSRNMNAGGACAVIETTDNTTPTASVPTEGGFFIPVSTPFSLTGEATDDEDINMLYNWEEYDAEDILAPLGNPQLNSPAFRSYPPTSSLTRVFPRMELIVNNGFDEDEVLPDYGRDFTFRFSIRDCHPGAGGFDWAEIAFKSTDDAGPFLLTAPNAGTEIWETGDYVEVTWDMANTDLAPVNCQRVNIKLSMDGGYTYPMTLAENTLNDGSQFVVVPDVSGTEFRVMVEAADNIFFDISDANFEIVTAAQPGFSFSAPIVEGERVCLPNTVTIDFETAPLLGFSEMINLSADGLPANVNATFDPNPASPGDAVTLTLDIPEDINLHGNMDFGVRASATGVDDQTRPISYVLISNDYSALTLESPADGATGESTLVTFDWNDLVNADNFDFELASDPTFSGGSLVVSETGLTESMFTSPVTLDENAGYFWRVRPENECTEGDFSAPFSFQTVSLSCNDAQSDHSPINIPSAGLPVIESEIVISDNGLISDINIPNIKGNHDAVGDLEFRLRAPNDQTVVLFSDPTCGVTQFNFGFDDESVLTPPSPCAPNTGLVFQPQETLSTFNGMDVQGTWTLEVAVVNEIGAGGTFESWSFEFCGAFEVNNPYLVNNNPLRVPPNEGRRISTDSLLVQDDDGTSPGNLEYTIVVAPAFGTLLFNGAPITVGDVFTQSDINNNKVRYRNDDENALDDSFAFVVRNGNGGFLGTPRFEFIIDPDAPVSTNEPDMASRLSLYPNPAKTLVTIDFGQVLNMDVEVSATNVRGQLVQTASFEKAEKNIRLKTDDWASGVYFISIKTEEGVFSKKVVIE